MAEEQPEEVKVEARQFMADVLPTAAESEFQEGGVGMDMTAWKSLYAAAANNNNKNKKDDGDENNNHGNTDLMETFWSQYYDPKSTSLWTMTYDEADSNENLPETIDIVTSLVEKTMNQSLDAHCFGVVHVLESLEVEGLWIFNGPDPERLFGANDDTSWFTWRPIGPDANDYVRKAVAAVWVPDHGQLHVNIIQHSQAFC
mmetsp:Transcript_7678/g.21363  ORF Transcript_7678/g.21363 Transcript_7678/m.21363 type:complete len:201 (+) Transcript_7678:50-652(+)|eukprot:CAMPEP_0168749364 /NCGR_PEP_ID=MMETSP0724-20121128/16678_1 /TAXON_ID=265536 /ORGANISM="Amphiprora sp., Strain CCMP467" /LENGTH=200 /DNA_ID=CAMNT_0008797271 /DNA_START=16 /DNA_END=618 /DNA_ORIENTATION=+